MLITIEDWGNKELLEMLVEEKSIYSTNFFSKRLKNNITKLIDYGVLKPNKIQSVIDPDYVFTPRARDLLAKGVELVAKDKKREVWAYDFSMNMPVKLETLLEKDNN